MSELKVKEIGNINPTFESQGRVYDKNGLCPTLRTFQGGGLQPKIIEDFYANRNPRSYENVAPTIRAEREGLKVIEETKCVGGLSDSVWGGKQYHQQYRVYKGDIALAEPANIPGGSYKYIVAMRGRGESNEQQLELNTQGVDNALTTVQKDNLVMETPRYRIRKLTPRECWRLMGYTDEDFDKAAKVNSNTQLYKEAGNAIVKQVLMAIFLQMKPKMREQK